MVEQFTLEVVELVRTAPLWLVYLVFFVIAYLENVVPPVPGDVLVAFAGYLVAVDLVRFDVVLAGTTLASVAGFMTMYALGSHWGDGINTMRHRHWLFRFIGFEYMDRARRWMNRTGPSIILLNRFLSGTRSVIALLAGISHVPVRVAVVYSLVSSLMWNAMLIGAGWLVKEKWESIGGYLNTYGGVILAGLAVFGAYRYYRHRRMNRLDNDPKDD